MTSLNTVDKQNFAVLYRHANERVDIKHGKLHGKSAVKRLTNAAFFVGSKTDKEVNKTVIDLLKKLDKSNETVFSVDKKTVEKEAKQSKSLNKKESSRKMVDAEDPTKDQATAADLIHKLANSTRFKSLLVDKEVENLAVIRENLGDEGIQQIKDEIARRQQEIENAAGNLRNLGML